MLKSCKYCGRIHDSKYICKEKPNRKKEVTEADKFRWTRLWQKKREEMKEIHTELRIGSQIMFAGGIYGRVVGINDEEVNVEVAKNTVIKISRYAIQSIDNK